MHGRCKKVAATTAPLGSAPSREKGRNHYEHRTVTVFHPAGALTGTEWHLRVAVIVQVKREAFTRSAATGLLCSSAETAFYVSNTPLTAVRAAQAVRDHWRVENTSHYSLKDDRKFKSLKRYLATSHGMIPAEYRTKWSLPADYPLGAPAYAAKRSELARSTSLGRKAAAEVVLEPEVVEPAPAEAPKKRGRAKTAA